MTKPRKMLSNWDAPYLQTLIRQIETQSKATLITWAVDYSEHVLLPLWSKNFPEDSRPKNSIDAARAWLRGEVKLPAVRKIILSCHQAARDADGFPAAQAAARAIGQSASTVHSARHCVGLPLYGALAVAYDLLGEGAKWEDLEKEAAEQCVRMYDALLNISVQDESNPAKINWNC